MSCLGRVVSILLVTLLALSSMVMVESAFAQTIPKPSVPEFTVKFIPSYNNVTTTDPYTGANTTTTQNHSIIELTITNQQYTYSNGSTFSIYYNVRTRGHFSNDWTELYPTIRLLPQSGNYTLGNFQNYQSDYIWGENSNFNHRRLPQSDLTYTIDSLPATNYPTDGQVDIEVEAMLGVNSTYYLPNNNFINLGGTYLPAVAYVTSSDWSNIQTITIPSGSNSTPNPTATPADNSSDNSVTSLLTSLALVAIAVSVAVVISLLLYVRHLKRRISKPHSSEV